MTAEEQASLSREAVQSAICQGLLEPEAAKPLAVQHLFERGSVAGQLHAAGVLLRRAIGKATVEEAERFSATDPLFVRTMGGYLTTAEVLAEEALLLKRVECGRAKFSPLGGSEEWPISDPRVLASEEQTLAIEHVLRTRALLTAVRGAAGTGKTTMMTE